MKKTTLFLLTTISIFMCIKSMEMDVEEHHNHTPSNTSESSSTISTKSSNSNPTDKLLKQNLEATKETNVLLRTLIMQNKIHFEYEDNKKYTTNVTINQHAKNTQSALEDLYKSTNTQLKNKTLHIPMTSATVPTTAQTTKSSKIEDLI